MHVSSRALRVDDASMRVTADAHSAASPHGIQERGELGLGHLSASSRSLTLCMKKAAECDPRARSPCAVPTPSFHVFRRM